MPGPEAVPLTKWPREECFNEHWVGDIQGDGRIVFIRVNTPDSNVSSNQIRKRGFKFVAIGSGLFAIVVFFLIWLSSHSRTVVFPIIGASLPLALGLIGSVELITGVPFQRLGNNWMRLHGWQRGVLGTLIVLLSLAIFMCLATFFVMMFT